MPAPVSATSISSDQPPGSFGQAFSRKVIETPEPLGLGVTLPLFLTPGQVGGPRLGDLRAGALASAASVSVTMVSGGVVVVVAMALVALLVPSFWLFRASRATA